MIHFDHAYTPDAQHRFWRRLEKLGFLLDPAEVEHPGKRICRFLKFREPGGDFSYLEFIHVRAGGRSRERAGLSFGCSGPLEKLHKRMVKDGRYRSRFVHKNYEWKIDNKSRLPGWNYLSFKGLGMRGLYPWITEYERYAKLKGKVKKAPRHPNGAQRIRALSLELHEKGEDFFSYLLGRKVKAHTKLSNGFELFITRSRRTRLNAVVVECTNLKKILAHASVEREEFFGQAAARIRNPDPKMWDIVLVQKARGR